MNKEICPKILGVVLISIIINLTLTSKAIAATYYVDSTDGLDTNNGTSESTPWQTINKVNTSTFNPGDNILFKKGRIWREILIPPSSGTDGSPITFSNYGSGSRPQIYRSFSYDNWYEYSLVRNSSFEFYTGTIDDDIEDTIDQWIATKNDTLSKVLAVSDTPDGTDTAMNLKRVDSNTTGLYIRDNFTVSPSTTYYLEFYGKKDSTAYGKVQIWDNNNLYLQDNGTWGASLNYLESIEVLEPTWTKKSMTFTTTGSVTSLYISFRNYSGSGSTNTGLGSFLVDGVYLVAGTAKPVYKIWEGVYPNILNGRAYGFIENGARVPLHDRNVEMPIPTMTDGYFYTLPGTIYYNASYYFYYRKDSGLPMNSEVGSKKFGVYIDNKSYLVFDGIDIYGADGSLGPTDPSNHGVYILNNSNNITFENSEISFTNTGGIYSAVGTSDIKYININAHDNATTPLYIRSNGGEISDSRSYHNGKVVTDSTALDRGGIGVHNGGNIIIKDNEVYDNGQSDQRADMEISIMDTSAPVIITRNYVHDCVQGCMQIAVNSNNSEVSYNIIDGFGTTTATGESWGAFSGIRIGAGISGPSGLKIYNNIFANGANATGTTKAAIAMLDSQTVDAQIKNNIFYNNNIPDVLVNSTTGATGFEIDNNIYSKSDYTNNWNWKGTNYSSLSAWNTARGFDTNSSTNNPDFVNAGSSDYRLKSTSWGIDRGIDVGLLLDKNGVTVPQGEGVDIGAYELSGSFSEVGTTDNTKESGIKLRSPKKDEYKNDKTPKFRFRKMDDSSIEKYQVLVKEKKSGKEYVYIDDITPNGGKKEEDDNKKVWYKNDEIEVESKTKLRNMEYNWWVKAKNNLEQLNKSEERKLHIDTTKPLLNITKIGNKIIGINETPTVYTLINGKIDIEGSLSENGDISIQDENKIEVFSTETKEDKTWSCSVATKNKMLTVVAKDKSGNYSLPISIIRR